jgi:hypothetical protein
MNWNDKGMAVADITRIDIWIGSLAENPKATVIGQFSVCYGNVLQQHGTKRGVMNPKNYVINFNPGERIKSVKVFRNSKFIVGIQFQTSQKNWTPIYGQETRLVTQLKSPYSNKFYLKYFHGTADNIIHSIKAEFASTLKSPFVQTEAIKAQINNQETTSGYSTLSSVGSTERSDEEPTGSVGYGLPYLDQSRHSVHSTQSAPLVRSDLDSAYGTASGNSTRDRMYNSFRSSSDPPMQVNDLLNNSAYSSYSPSGSGNLINEQHVIRDQHRVKPIKPQRSYYVGKQATPSPTGASSHQLPPAPKYHNKSNPPTYQKSQSATSLALNRPIYKLTNQNRSYNHSKL